MSSYTGTMKIHDAITAGIAHLQQNPLRAGLSILGILIGIASVLCMVAIGDGAKKIMVDDIERIGGANHIRFRTRTSIFRRGRRHPTSERYTLADANAIEAECSNVIAVLPRNLRSRILATTHKGGETRSGTLEGTTPDYSLLMHWNLREGRFLSENDIDNATQVCVLGADVATELFGDSSPLGQEIKLRYHWRQVPIRVNVVGVMVPKGRNLSIAWGNLDDVICVPITTYQQRITGIGYVERLTVFFEKEADVYNVINSIREVLRERHQGTDNFVTYWIPKANVKRIQHIEKVIKFALGGIAGFSLFVSGISIMNMCLISVGEKTQEIGVRKSVGARRIDIFWQFLTESVSLCFCGAFLGIFFGWFTAHGLARLAVRIVPIVPEWPVVLSMQWILISVLFSIFMGVVFGVYPAIRAAWMSPVEALRSDA